MSGIDTNGAAGLLGVLAATAMLAGAIAWSYSCWLRGVDPERFATGDQPGWPFRTYVVATFAGLAMLGAAQLLVESATWVGWLVLGVDGAFVAIYAATHDLPPFVFYLLLIGRRRRLVTPGPRCVAMLSGGGRDGTSEGWR